LVNVKFIAKVKKNLGIFTLTTKNIVTTSVNQAVRRGTFVCRRIEICNSGKKYTMCPLCSVCGKWPLSASCLMAKLDFLFDNTGTVVFATLMSFWGEWVACFSAAIEEGKLGFASYASPCVSGVLRSCNPGIGGSCGLVDILQV